MKLVIFFVVVIMMSCGSEPKKIKPLPTQTTQEKPNELPSQDIKKKIEDQPIQNKILPIAKALSLIHI